MLQLTERKEFDRQTLDGTEEFLQEIPFLEGAFSTKYFIADKITGSMMVIYNDKVEEVEAEAQFQPFNLAQLQHVLATLEQRCQGFDASSIADPQEKKQKNAHVDAQDLPQDNRFQTQPHLRIPIHLII